MLIHSLHPLHSHIHAYALLRAAAATATPAAFCAGTLAALAPGSDAAAWASAHGTLLAAAGGAGMASATALIHIYINPIKRMLQALVAVGLAGGVNLVMAHPDTPLPAYVAEHPEAVWLVGPAFAALTGVAAKEALCYGKKESLALAVALPLLLLGHLTGLAPPVAESVLAAAAAALLLVFAGRKWTQPIKVVRGRAGWAGWVVPVLVWQRGLQGRSITLRCARTAAVACCSFSPPTPIPSG